MRIRSISIQKKYNASGYDCTVSVDGEYQQMVLTLDEDYTQRVIDVVAELIVDGSRRVAENLTKQALDHKAIEHKPA